MYKYRINFCNDFVEPMISNDFVIKVVVVVVAVAAAAVALAVVCFTV